MPMYEVPADIISESSRRNPVPKDIYNADIVSKLSNEDVAEHLAMRIREKVGVYYPDLSARNVIVKGRAWGGQETARTLRFEIKSHDSQVKRIIFVKLCPIFERLNPSLTE